MGEEAVGRKRQRRSEDSSRRLRSHSSRRLRSHLPLLSNEESPPHENRIREDRRTRMEREMIIRQPRRESHHGSVGVGFRIVGLPSVGGIIFPRYDGHIPNAREIMYQIMQSDLGVVLNDFLRNIADNHRGTPPAAVSEVQSLPVRTIKEKEKEEEEKQCAVCTCDFVTGDQAKQMPCQHIFHPDCIDPWLKRHNTCPICRKEMRTDDVEYERRKERS